MRRRLVPLFLILAGLAAALPARAAVQALLIAQSDYKAAGLPDLLGPPNDIALMQTVLTQRFAIPSANVKVLANPGHAEVERAFAELLARTQPGDQVYVHYSGHGSWAPAPAPAGADEEAERRGQDQTWVVHGARAPGSSGKDALDVLDKEIALWLDPIYQRTPDVVVVSDSCHSASVTRDVQRGVRSVDGELQPHPLRSSVRRVPAPTVGLRIGAARDTESAVEFNPETQGPCGAGKGCYGVFTWHWAQALQASRPGESWGDVYNRAAASLAAISAVTQRPQMEGVAGREVFGGRFAPLSARVPVVELAGDGSVGLGAGLLSGVVVGSEFEADGSDTPRARLRITSATAGTAQAQLLSGRVRPGQLLRETSHAGSQPVRLFVGAPAGADVDEALVRQVRSSVEGALAYGLQGFALVPQREQADWRLEVLRPGAGSTGAAGERPVHAPCSGRPCPAPSLWVLSPAGQLVHAQMRFDLDRGEAELPRLQANLVRYLRAREVRAIGAQGGTTPLELMVEVLRPPAGQWGTCARGAQAGSGWARQPPRPIGQLGSAEVQAGDCLAFKLVNRDPARDWYGYLLSVDGKLAITPVWPAPTASEDEARIDRRASFDVRSRYYRLCGPARETLLFVASEAPAPVASLAQSGLRGDGARAAGSPLARLLQAGTLTRGVEAEVGEWGAQSVELDMPAEDVCERRAAGR